jgi:5-methylcytosine-specific restriction endonuclease McrA
MSNHPPVGSHAWLRWFRSQKPWRNLAKQVVADEPICWLRLPGCTIRSTTADHILPAAQRPELALVRSNIRGACHSCNSKRADKHPRKPELYQPPKKVSTSSALRHIAAQRKPASATQFFNANRR